MNIVSAMAETNLSGLVGKLRWIDKKVLKRSSTIIEDEKRASTASNQQEQTDFPEQCPSTKFVSSSLEGQPLAASEKQHTKQLKTQHIKMLHRIQTNNVTEERRTSVTQTVIPVTSVVDSSPQSLLDEHNQIESDNEVEISWSEEATHQCDKETTEFKNVEKDHCTNEELSHKSQEMHDGHTVLEEKEKMIQTLMEENSKIVSALHDQLASAFQQVHDAKETLYSKQKEVVELKEKLQLQEVELKEFRNKKEGTNSKIELLQSQVLKLQCSFFDERRHNENLKKEFSKLADEVRDKEKEKLVLTSQVNNYRKRCDELKKTLIQIQDKCKSLEDQLKGNTGLETELKGKFQYITEDTTFSNEEQLISTLPQKQRKFNKKLHITNQMSSPIAGSSVPSVYIRRYPSEGMIQQFGCYIHPPTEQPYIGSYDHITLGRRYSKQQKEQQEIEQKISELQSEMLQQMEQRHREQAKANEVLKELEQLKLQIETDKPSQHHSRNSHFDFVSETSNPVTNDDTEDLFMEDIEQDITMTESHLLSSDSSYIQHIVSPNENRPITNELSKTNNDTITQETKDKVFESVSLPNENRSINNEFNLLL